MIFFLPGPMVSNAWKMSFAEFLYPTAGAYWISISYMTGSEYHHE